MIIFLLLTFIFLNTLVLHGMQGLNDIKYIAHPKSDQSEKTTLCARGVSFEIDRSLLEKFNYFKLLFAWNNQQSQEMANKQINVPVSAQGLAHLLSLMNIEADSNAGNKEQQLEEQISAFKEFDITELIEQSHAWKLPLITQALCAHLMQHATIAELETIKNSFPQDFYPYFFCAKPSPENLVFMTKWLAECAHNPILQPLHQQIGTYYAKALSENGYATLNQDTSFVDIFKQPSMKMIADAIKNEIITNKDIKATTHSIVKTPDCRLESVAQLSPHTVALGIRGEGIKLFDQAQKKFLKTIKGFSVWNLKKLDESTLVSHDGQRIDVIDINAPKRKGFDLSCVKVMSTITSFETLEDKALIATGDRFGNISLYDKQERKIEEWQADAVWIHHLSYLNSVLASSADNTNEVKLWKIDTGSVQLIKTIQPSAHAMSKMIQLDPHRIFYTTTNNQFYNIYNHEIPTDFSINRSLRITENMQQYGDFLLLSIAKYGAVPKKQLKIYDKHNKKIISLNNVENGFITKENTIIAYDSAHKQIVELDIPQLQSGVTLMNKIKERKKIELAANSSANQSIWQLKKAFIHEATSPIKNFIVKRNLPS